MYSEQMKMKYQLDQLTYNRFDHNSSTYKQRILIDLVINEDHEYLSSRLQKLGLSQNIRDRSTQLYGSPKKEQEKSLKSEIFLLRWLDRGYGGNEQNSSQMIFCIEGDEVNSMIYSNERWDLYR